MSWVRVWIHVVFATKYRAPLLDGNIRQRVFQHIMQNAKTKGLRLDCVNGYTDHAHCLILLERELSISKTVQLIKGESSHWINQNNLLRTKFHWQDDYWAVGISESGIKNVRRYIMNQDQHHSKKSFDDELDEFKDEGGLRGVLKDDG